MIKAPELEGCEGGEVLDGLVYFACTSVKDRTQYFPGSALKSTVNPGKAQGWLTVFDPKTETAQKLKYLYAINQGLTLLAITNSILMASPCGKIQTIKLYM
jgi:hypothetical protein